MTVSKRTLVVGASEKPERYSNKAIRSLLLHGHEVLALAPRPGRVENVEFLTGQPGLTDLDTVTLYLGEKAQETMMDYLLSLRPRRIIFNPGAENPELKKKAEALGIETEEACTLVLLATDQY
ncbi:MAG: CoA-binding protein [Bacteroidota bacterium]|uniref:CoA-binding protein n=1 Tax=Candidatus Pollutiaquabacter sp. TaxID=3416354 RepID=UPI003BF6D343|nr:CoA-binding protein [Bacteroidota bacterium]